MHENQIASLIRHKLRPLNVWDGLSIETEGVPPVLRVRTKQNNEDGSPATYRIIVVKEDTQEEDTPMSEDQIYNLREPEAQSLNRPASVTIRTRFMDNGYTYYAFAEPGTQEIRVLASTLFRHHYKLRPKYVIGGLYWSPTQEGFFLYQGEDKTPVSFFPAKTVAGSAVASNGPGMPADAKRVCYPEGSSFILSYCSQGRPAS